MELTVNGVGVATADPELRHVGEKNMAVCTVNLAFNRNFRKNDEWQKEVCFLKAQIWGNQAEKMAESVKKGQPIYINGYMKQNSWEDDKGNKRSMHLVSIRTFQLCVKAPKNENGNGPQAPEAVTASSGNSANPPISDDDIPF